MDLHDKVIADIHQVVDGVRFTAKDGLYVEGELVSVEVLALRGDEQQERCDLELRINPHGPDPSTAAEILQDGRETFVSMLFKDDAPPAVRTAAALAAGRLGCGGAVRDAVLNHLLHLLCDEDSAVRDAAADALGKLGSVATRSGVLDRLKALAKDNLTDLGLVAVLAIGELSDRTCADHADHPPRDSQGLASVAAGIATALHGDDPPAWQRAAAVAEDYHHRTAEDVLTGLLGDRGDRRLRCQAIRQLEALSCPSVPAEALACIPFVFKTGGSRRYAFTTPRGHARFSDVGADSEVTLATDLPELSDKSRPKALAAKLFAKNKAASLSDAGCSLVEVPIGADMLLAFVDVERHQVRFRTSCKWLVRVSYTLRLAGGEVIQDIVQLSEDADGVMTGLINRPELETCDWKIEFQPLPPDPSDGIRPQAMDRSPADE